ncbi:hypothetical protein Dda_7524 [Drechslerella dactyloides]|uniref:protein-histidine N-methyltransferase n=1 Tax=Drechslerella dactyloides TaxID=74499 RepID=A0AAD6ISS8_DREDA|nr:hypothetical protein Dda_7524 [Drechslerella dactyloides]
MSFKFNFDLPVDEDGAEVQTNDAEPASSGPVATEAASASRLPAAAHSLDDLISQLPPHIAYSTLQLPLSPSRTVTIPRRELFDVKMQLMAEDTMAANSGTTSTNDRFTAAFTDEDIRTNTYEGGLKSWECSSDLVKQLAENDEIWQPYCRRILELGCGTALPTCYILQTLLASPSLPLSHGVHLTLADYNIDVLRLVTLPNLLLAYVYATSYTAPPDSTDQQDGEGGERIPINTQGSDANVEPAETEITISQHLITSFTAALAARNITISFLSGSWGPEMVSLVHGDAGQGVTTSPPSTMATLLLASETIYSPSSIAQFVEMVEGTLDGVDGRGYIAAKDVYFGVGGSVADFVALMEGKGWRWEVVREEKRGIGVGRVVGVLTMR